MAPIANRLYRRLATCVTADSRSDKVTGWLLKPNPAAFAVLVVVFNLHPHHRADPRKRVNHDPNEGPVSKANEIRHLNDLVALASLSGERDRIKEPPGIFGGKDGGLAALYHVLRASNRSGRVVGHHLADHEPNKVTGSLPAYRWSRRRNAAGRSGTNWARRVTTTW